MLRPHEHPLESEDAFRHRMVEYIRQHFGDILGVHAALLDTPDGLERLREMLQAGAFSGAPIRRDDAA